MPRIYGEFLYQTATKKKSKCNGFLGAFILGENPSTGGL